MRVFDASALLAFLQGEAGAEMVESDLDAGFAACSVVNWSETAQKVLQHGGNWEVARSFLLSSGLTVEPLGVIDAESAARWAGESHLSLGDRVCPATAARMEATVFTADEAWGESETIRQVR